MDLLGSKGRLRLLDSGMRLEWSAAAPSPHFLGYVSLHPGEHTEARFGDVALTMIEDLVNALGRGVDPRCSGMDGVAALAAADAACRSIALGAECSPE